MFFTHFYHNMNYVFTHFLFTKSISYTKSYTKSSIQRLYLLIIFNYYIILRSSLDIAIFIRITKTNPRCKFI